MEKHAKKFNPAKRKKLNNPTRLKWIPPRRVWELVDGGQNGRYVDIGAGTGYMTKAIFEAAGQGIDIHALDIEPLMVEEMKSGLLQDTPITAELMERDKLPFQDAAIDGIWTITLYHELEPPEPLLAEIKRVLCPGGRLLIVDWDKKEEACEHGPPLDHRVAAEEVCTLLANTGFTNIEIAQGFHFHYGVRGTLPVV